MWGDGLVLMRGRSSPGFLGRLRRKDLRGEHPRYLWVLVSTPLNQREF